MILILFVYTIVMGILVALCLIKINKSKSYTPTIQSEIYKFFEDRNTAIFELTELDSDSYFIKTDKGSYLIQIQTNRMLFYTQDDIEGAKKLSNKLSCLPTKNLMNELRKFNNAINVRPELIEFYKKILLDKPWKLCNCPICKNIGIDVIIFRGNNRNRRRGFHNINTFYNILRS